MDSTTRTALITMGVMGLFFLLLGGVNYATCMSRCDQDCAEFARQTNPFGVGRNDLGRGLCDMQVSSCKKGCSFF